MEPFRKPNSDDPAEPSEVSTDPSRAMPTTIRAAIIALLNPITLFAFVLMMAVLVLIGAGLFGWDKGQILNSLAKSDYARGLITYLFAIGTIGIAVVLVLSALLGEDSIKERFARGKEVLSLLIGVFGTMVGFYFGSQIATANNQVGLEVAAPLLSDTAVVGGEPVTLTTRAAGGKAPYIYAISVDSASVPVIQKAVGSDGWIREELTTPKVDTLRSFLIRLGVKDASGDSTLVTRTVRLNPKK